MMVCERLTSGLIAAGRKGKSVLAEVYPALWMRRFDRDERGGDEHAAYATAAWLQRAERNGSPASFFIPPLTSKD
jgi:hypothetical protein